MHVGFMQLQRVCTVVTIVKLRTTVEQRSHLSHCALSFSSYGVSPGQMRLLKENQ